MRFSIILVEPARAENIGAAARAMKTMGFTELRIVNSRVFEKPNTRWVAHGATDIIDNIQYFDSLSEALVDTDFRIATTARSRAKFHYYASPEELLTLLEEKQHWVAHTALIFGREDTGLTNEELAFADVLTGVPMVADYPSLNLGQAVMVYCYQLSSLMMVKAEKQEIVHDQQLTALRHRFSSLLSQLDVSDDHKMADWINQRLGLFSQRDTAMLHRLLHDIEKKISD